MKSDSEKEQKKKQYIERSRELAIFEHYWGDRLPGKDDYDFSVWAMWESRIRKGHEEEEALISKAAKRWESTRTEEQKKLMPDDMFTDDFAHSQELTNAMYAALVVSLWSCVEGYLKDLLGVCKRAKHPDKKRSVGHCDIRITREAFDKEVNVKLEEQPDYAVVNTVRILCNSFKHSEGFYLPKDEKPDTQIDSDLLTKWNCISNRFIELKEIDYTKLPVKELVLTCGTFCQSVLSGSAKNLERLGYGL